MKTILRSWSVTKPASLLLLLQLVALPSLPAATHTWTGATGDGKWSTAANWSGGAPVAGEAANVVLVFPAAGSKNTTNDISSLTIDQIQVSGDNYLIAAIGGGVNVTLRSGNVLSSTFFITGANAVLADFNFTVATNTIANASASVAAGDTATLRCRFTGPGGFIKRANGTLILDGNAANTYGGGTEIHGGTLKLSQTGNAIPGDLVIGLPSITNLAAVTLLAPNQVADGARVFVHFNGTFSPDVFSESISSITLSNANLVAGVGLTINGPFTSVGSNTVTGKILLGGGDRTFDVTGHLLANCFIENPAGFAGIIKAGPGTLELQRTNSYNGITTVNAGTLCVAHAGGLGTAGVGTQVNDGASLQIAPAITLPAEQLFLLGHGVNGNGALILGSNAMLHGNIQLSTDVTINVLHSNSQATVFAQMTGNGTLTKIGRGVLQLGGGSANSFDGAEVKQGALWLSKENGATAVAGFLTVGQGLAMDNSAEVRLRGDNQIADNARVYVDADGELNLDGFFDYSDAIGTLTLRLGEVKTGLGVLTLNGDVMVVNHPLWPGYGSLLTGSLGLNGNPRLVTIATNTSLSVYGSLMDGGISSSLHKAGPGSMECWGGHNTYSGETQVLEGQLAFLSSRPGAPTGGTVVQKGAELLLWSAGVTNEMLTLNGHGGAAPYQAALQFKGACNWFGPIHVASDTTVLGQTGMSAGDAFLTVSGQLSGPGNLRLREIHEFIPSSTIHLTGGFDNTMTGAILLESGELELNKSGGAVAVSGPLIVGTTNAGVPATVRLLSHNQIDNGVIPYIRPSGTLDLGDFNDAVGGLEADGGIVTSSGGVLTLLGDVWTRNITLGSLQIHAPVSLGGAVRTFHLGANGQPGGLSLLNTISDGGAPGGFVVDGVSQYGGSTCSLTASNSFTGPVIVQSGRLMVGHPHALGSPVSGTTVSNAASLLVSSLEGVYEEPLTLSGVGLGGRGALELRNFSHYGGSTNTWNGPVALTTNGSIQTLIATSESAALGNNVNLVINGPIVGTSHLLLKAEGSIILAGTQDNSYTGDLRLERGRLVLAKTNAIAVPHHLEIGNGRAVLARHEQIADAALLSIHSGGELQFSNHVETVARLAGDGTVSVGEGTLRLVEADASVATLFSGTITGGGAGTNLVKLGAATQTFTGTNTYTGSTHLQGGRLVINGRSVNTATFITNNATLAGTGTLGSVVVNGGTVLPGATTNATSYGKLTALGNVTFKAGSKLRLKIAGTDPGMNHDQFVAGSQFNLAGGALEAVVAPGTTTNGDQVAIVRTLIANPPAGSFAGLPEAQIFQPLPARSFQITYAGGDGNDIVITQLNSPNPATLTGFSMLPDGSFQVQATGSPGIAYVVEYCDDLNAATWTALAQATADGNGLLEIIDADAATLPKRFYRVVLP